MRPLIVIGLIALLGAGALGYAWHVLGELPERSAAAPGAPVPAGDGAPDATDLARVEAREALPEPVDDPPSARAPAGFEEGGAGPLVRDYAVIYADRSVDERRAALVRLSAEIAAARERLGKAELDELAGRSGNAPTTPGVRWLLELLEERAWVQASLVETPAVVGEGER